MINEALTDILKKCKNLLAFSHGVDSTALFYILNEREIDFDIAIVNYNTREQSKEEIASARGLASKFNKRIFELSVSLESSNFECRAREARYDFFTKICSEFGYANLILAHQLDDKFEWFLMQLGKGAGLNELLGMREFEKREKFNIVRPLLNIRKTELLNFLNERKLKYFLDHSNEEMRFKRNLIRAKFSEPFLDIFKSGVAKSFEFLENDMDSLKPEILNPKDRLYLVKNDKNAIRGIDRACKLLGVVMSEAQRRECQRCLLNKTDCAISAKVAVGYFPKFIFITPFVKDAMDKKFKDACRALKVPKINRPYLHQIGFEIENLREFV